MKKGLIFGLMLVMLFAFSATAKAAIVLNDWTLDLSGVYAGGPVISDIQQIAFFGIAHTEVVNDVAPIGQASIGDQSAIDGLLSATQFIDSGGVIIPPVTSELNINYEMTFSFSVGGQTITDPDPSTDYVHIPAGIVGQDGYLDIYLDTSIDSSAGTGSGYMDGLWVARMIDDATGAGVFTPLEFDGSDDATFTTAGCAACFVLPGIFFAELDPTLPGLEDLSTADATLAITDSNFDADPQDLGGFSISAPSAWPFALQSEGGETGFFALEDGSARLAVAVPEPATMLLLGSGLLGLGLYSRKRK